MEVVASGAFWDARTAPVNERSASSTSAVALADGTVLATCRLGTDREGADGHVGVFATADGGESWELRFLGLGERVWDGWPGEARGWYVTELEPGELDRVGALDGPLGPEPPVGPPGDPGPARDAQLPDPLDRWRAVLAGSSADRPRPAPGRLGHRVRSCASRTGRSPSRSRTGRSTRTPTPGHPVRLAAAVARRRGDLDRGRPRRRVTRTTRSTTGTSVSRRIPSTVASSTCSGRTSRPTAATSTSTSAGARPTAGPGPTRSARGCAGQHCQPIALGGDRLLAVYSHRSSPGGIHAALSEDFGRTWDRDRELVVWASEAGDEPGSGAPRAQEEYWNDMGAWQFGHPRGALLPNGEVLRRVLRRDGEHAQRSLGAGPGVTDLLLRDARVVDARGARPGRVDILVRAGRIAAIGEALDARRGRGRRRSAAGGSRRA